MRADGFLTGSSFHGGILAPQRRQRASSRFTRDSKTDDWIKLDYESLREGSTFVSFGAVR
jgi:hypothetical protein